MDNKLVSPMTSVTSVHPDITDHKPLKEPHNSADPDNDDRLTQVAHEHKRNQMWQKSAGRAVSARIGTRGQPDMKQRGGRSMDVDA